MTVSKLEKPFVNQLGNKHFSLVTAGCQGVTNQSLGLWNWGLRFCIWGASLLLMLTSFPEYNAVHSILWYFIEKSKYCPVHTVYCNISIILMGNDVLLFGLTVFLQEFVFCILSDSFCSSSWACGDRLGYLQIQDMHLILYCLSCLWQILYLWQHV